MDKEKLMNMTQEELTAEREKVEKAIFYQEMSDMYKRDVLDDLKRKLSFIDELLGIDPN